MHTNTNFRGAVSPQRNLQILDLGSSRRTCAFQLQNPAGLPLQQLRPKILLLETKVLPDQKVGELSLKAVDDVQLSPVRALRAVKQRTLHDCANTALHSYTKPFVVPVRVETRKQPTVAFGELYAWLQCRLRLGEEEPSLCLELALSPPPGDASVATRRHGPLQGAHDLLKSKIQHSGSVPCTPRHQRQPLHARHRSGRKAACIIQHVRPQLYSRAPRHARLTQVQRCRIVAPEGHNSYATRVRNAA